MPTRTPDYSAQRRATILSLLTEQTSKPGWTKLSSDARLLFVVGALVCNDAGVIQQSDLDAAWIDPWAKSYARRLLMEVS